MRAYIQHKDSQNQKLILQALVPFTDLSNSVLFTYRAQETQGSYEKQAQFQASMDFYQRRVDAKRSNDIKEFIRQSILLEKKGAQLATLFPTSMIIALEVDEDEFSGNNLEFIDDETCSLEFSSNVFIVDGQHRMMGMIKLYDELGRYVVRTEDDDYVFDYLKKYKFNCTILVNYDLWEQGQVFVNVNFKQKPVNKSLYYEIFGSEYRDNESDWERNQIYQAHQVAMSLNEHPDSPFYQRIKMLGTGNGYVSQAFVVESLQRNFKRGGLWYLDPDEKQDRESYFATELLSYFVAIKKSFPKYWPEAEATKGTIICKTTGFGAWIRLMGMMREDSDTILLKHLKESATKNEVCTSYVEQVIQILSPLKKYGEKLFGMDSEFRSFSGHGAEGKLYKKMLFYIQKQETLDLNGGNYPFDKDALSEELQEYIWVTPINDLVILGHHYDVENLENFKVKSCEQVIDTYEVKATFSVYVNIYLDNEDDTGFNMEFPAEATMLLDKEGDKFSLDKSSVKVSVDTDKYYG